MRKRNLKKYTHDEGREALLKVLFRCDDPKQLLVEMAASFWCEADDPETFVEAYARAVAVEDAHYKFGASLMWLSDVKAAMQVD